jgi:flagellar M-ring protein FliF
MTNESYDPNQTVVLTSQVSEERMQGPGALGIPGTDSNVPAAESEEEDAAASETAETIQLHRTDNKTYTVSRTIHRTVDPPGTIKRITAAVMIDDAVEHAEQDGLTVQTRRKRTAEEMERFREIASAAIGINPERGDRLAIENLTFERDPVMDAPVEPTMLQRYLPIANRWVGALRYVSLLILFGFVYMFMLRPVKKQMVAAFKELPARLGAGTESPAAMLAGENNASLASGAGLELDTGNSAGENQRALQLKQHVVNSVKKEPTEASRVIQGWIGPAEERS